MNLSHFQDTTSAPSKMTPPRDSSLLCNFPGSGVPVNAGEAKLESTLVVNTVDLLELSEALELRAVLGREGCRVIFDK